MHQQSRRNFQPRMSSRRDRFRERSREKSVPRDRKVRRFDRERSREKFPRRHSNERYSRRSKEKFTSSVSRDGRNRRSRSPENRWQYEQSIVVQPAELPNYSEFIRGSDGQQFHNSIEKLNFQQNLPELPDYSEFIKGNNQDICSKLSHVSDLDVPLPEYSVFSPASQNDIMDSDDKPDPWNTTSTQFKQLPTFGQERSSSLIPEFDPDAYDSTSRFWMKLINDVGRDKNWTSEEKKFHFSTKLLGRAKEWFLSGNKILEPWKTLKKQFLSAFPSDMDYYNLLLIMINRRKLREENLSTYFNYKIALLNNCNISGRKAVSCLIGGLNESVMSLKNEALNKNFATPTELYDFLSTRNVDGDTRNVDGDIVNTKSVKGSCFFCNKVGHIVNNCPIKYPKNAKTTGKNEIKDARFYKEVFIHNVLLMACFDESFPHITIREKDAEIAKIKYRRQISVINGTKGSTITTLGQTQVCMKVDLAESDVKVYIVKDVVQDTAILLGEAINKYVHCIRDEKGVHFINIVKENTRRHEQPSHDRPLFDDVSRTSYERKLHDRPESHSFEKPYKQFTYEQQLYSQSSPVRSPPGRSFEHSHPFLSKSMYGNPYL